MGVANFMGHPVLGDSNVQTCRNSCDGVESDQKHYSIGDFLQRAVFWTKMFG